VGVETVANGYHARILPPTDGGHGYVFLIDGGSLDCGASTASSGAGRTRHEENDRSEQGEGGDWDEEFDIDRVASVLSHDLRNPLDVAKARLRAARETGADEHFDHVERAHERMERIIEDVLTLSRGAEYIEPDETVELRTALESAWETVETGSATLTIADGLPTTVADGDRLERLLENLFRNAVEHGDHPAVTVGSLDDSTTGFYVADDGPGIPPEDHSVIFEPGYSSRDHGTGLGLSIVKRIAESHGWRVDVRNEASGVRFEIRGMDPGT
jgi:signal transduction histidine kinase